MFSFLFSIICVLQIGTLVFSMPVPNTVPTNSISIARKSLESLPNRDVAGGERTSNSRTLFQRGLLASILGSIIQTFPVVPNEYATEATDSFVDYGNMGGCTDESIRCPSSSDASTDGHSDDHNIRELAPVVHEINVSRRGPPPPDTRDV